MTMVAPDGTARGEPIAGSRFLRDFCGACGEPIRVHERYIGSDNRCPTCQGTKPRAASPDGALREKARQRNREDLGPVQVRRLPRVNGGNAMCYAAAPDV